MIANLAFPVEYGRKAVLETLHQIILKFPTEIVDDQADYIFLSVAMRLVNEDSPTCRVMVSSVIKALCGAVSEKTVNGIIKIILMWLTNTKFDGKSGDNAIHEETYGEEKVFEQQESSLDTKTKKRKADSNETDKEKQKSLSLIQRVASQSLGLIVEVRSSVLRGNLELFVQSLCDILVNTWSEIEFWIRSEGGQIELDVNQDSNQIDQKARKEKSNWELFYFVLLALDKLLKQCGTAVESLLALPERRKTWEIVRELLLHPHSWVRSEASRFVGLWFSLLEISDGIKHKNLSGVANEQNQQDAFLNDVEDVFELAKTLCRQLESPLLNKSLSEQTVKNLLFLAKALQILPDLPISIDGDNEVKIGDDQDKAILSKNDGNLKNEKKRKTLQWIIQRLSNISKKWGLLTKSAIVKFFAALAMQLDAEITQNYLISMLHPLLRFTDPAVNDNTLSSIRYTNDIDQLAINMSSSGMTADDLRSLSLECLEVIEQQVGHQNFSSAYTQVRQSIAQTRQERKRLRQQELVANPKLAASRKLKRSRQSIENRKRKAILDVMNGQHPKRKKK